MTGKCNDSTVGHLLFAYELNQLNEEEEERFDIHLLNCDFCAEMVEGFSREVYALQTEPSLLRALNTSHGDVGEESIWSRVKRLLWPRSPVILRPGVLLPLVLLLILPTVTRILEGPKPQGSVVRVVTLYQGRGMESAHVTNAGQGIIIAVACRFAGPDTPCSIRLQSLDGRFIFENPSSLDFDSSGVINLLMAEGLDEGSYVLTVSEAGRANGQQQEFRFSVEH